MRIILISTLVAITGLIFHFSKSKVEISMRESGDSIRLVAPAINKNEPKTQPILALSKANLSPEVAVASKMIDANESSDDDEKNQNARQEALMDEMVQELGQVRDLWDQTRAQTYMDIGVAEPEYRSLENMRSYYQSSFDELSQRFRQTTNPQQQDQILTQIRTQAGDFDKKVHRLLGDDRFKTLVGVLSQFNDDLDETNLRPRVQGNW